MNNYTYAHVNLLRFHTDQKQRSEPMSFSFSTSFSCQDASFYLQKWVNQSKMRVTMENSKSFPWCLRFFYPNTKLHYLNIWNYLLNFDIFQLARILYIDLLGAGIGKTWSSNLILVLVLVFSPTIVGARYNWIL